MFDSNFGLNFDFDLVISVTQLLRAGALSFFSRRFLLSLVHNYIDLVSYSMSKKLAIITLAPFLATHFLIILNFEEKNKNV